MARDLKPIEWLGEIEHGFDYRKKYGVEDVWADMEATFYNVAPEDEHPYSSSNLVYAMGDTLVSSLNIPNPEVNIKPVEAMSAEGATIVEKLDNLLIHDLNIRKEISDATLNAYLYGKGILKVGYDSEFGFNPQYDIGQTGNTGITMTQFDKRGKRIEYSGSSPGMPWLRSVAPHDIIVPWGTVNMKSARWVAHRLIRHIDDLRDDPKYTNVPRKIVNADIRTFTQSYLKSGGKLSHANRMAKVMNAVEFTLGENYVEFFEVHDRKTGRVYCVVPGHDKFIRNEVDLMQLNGLPFIGFNFIKSPRHFWSTPEAFYVHKFQKEINDIETVARHNRRTSNRAVYYDSNMIEEKNVDVAMSGKPDVKVPCNGDPRKAVYFSTIPVNDYIPQQELIRRNARETIGLSRNQAGEFDGGRRTATEASIVQRGADSRLSSKQIIISDVYTDVMTMINEIIFEFWKTPKIIDLGDEDQQDWVTFTGSDLKGNYRYKIHFTNGDIVSNAMDSQIALQMVQILKADPNSDPEKINRFIKNNVQDVEMAELLMVDTQQMQPALGGVR